jgi:hypothetical protein
VLLERLDLGKDLPDAIATPRALAAAEPVRGGGGSAAVIQP